MSAFKTFPLTWWDLIEMSEAVHVTLHFAKIMLVIFVELLL